MRSKSSKLMLLIRGKEREKQGTLWVKKRTENARVRESRAQATLLRWTALQVPFGRLGSSGVSLGRRRKSEARSKS